MAYNDLKAAANVVSTRTNLAIAQVLQEEENSMRDMSIAELVQEEERDRAARSHERVLVDYMSAGSQEDGSGMQLADTSHLHRQISGYLASTRHIKSMQHTLSINRPIRRDVDPNRAAHLLRERLEMYNLQKYNIVGDGNCQFRAISHQLYRSQEHFANVRHRIVTQLSREPDIYSPFVPGDYGAYLQEMSRNGTWGDNITAQAAADFFNICINVITSYDDLVVVEIVPHRGKSAKVIWVCLWAEIHYSSVIPAGSEPAQSTKSRGNGGPTQGLRAALRNLLPHNRGK